MNLGNALGLPEDPYRYQPDQRLVLPACRLGVEFEFEGVGLHRLELLKEGWTKYWQAKPDRSLHDQGMEYVFADPLWGIDAVTAVEKLCEWAASKKFKASMRTGLHVHVDVRDMDHDQLARLNILYALFERAVYRLAGNNRDNNVFCLPWYKADHMVGHVSKINTPNTDIRSASEALANEKYGGLNLDTLARFGSVEFRHALATTDAEWVIRWINVCLSFKKAAQKLDMPPLALIHNMSARGPVELARLVFEDMFDTINYPQLEEEVWRYGVETAIQIYPKQAELITIADLSWNKAKVEEKINPKFKAYVDRKAPAKPVFAPFFDPAAIADLVFEEDLYEEDPEPEPDGDEA